MHYVTWLGQWPGRACLVALRRSLVRILVVSPWVPACAEATNLSVPRNHRQRQSRDPAHGFIQEASVLVGRKLAITLAPRRQRDCRRLRFSLVGFASRIA